MGRREGHRVRLNENQHLAEYFLFSFVICEEKRTRGLGKRRAPAHVSRFTFSTVAQVQESVDEGYDSFYFWLFLFIMIFQWSLGRPLLAACEAAAKQIKQIKSSVTEGKSCWPLPLTGQTPPPFHSTINGLLKKRLECLLIESTVNHHNE